MDKIFKAFSTISKALDIDAGIYEAMITTEVVDRVGDVVMAAGAQVEGYLKNPVVLWAHDYSQPPVAKALSLQIIPGTGITAQFQFPKWDINPQADIIRRLWAGGFLNATSIGFYPRKSEDRKSETGTADWYQPQTFLEWELLEFSIVPVPANQEALRLAVKALVTRAGLKPLLRSGRVLSAANERRIREASDLLGAVLDQLEAPDAEEERLTSSLLQNAEEAAEAATTDSSETNIDLTSNDASEEQLAEKLSNFLKLTEEVLR
jgi:HK97 family phage prohead protease